MIKKTVILVLVSLLSTSATARGAKGYKILDDLNLSAEQLEKVKEFRLKHKEKRKSLKGDKKNHRNQMKKLFVDGASDDKLRKLHENIRNHQNSRAEIKLEKMIFLKNLLNKEQRATYLEKKKENRKKRFKK